jgi:hypothetical protein
MTLTQLGDSNLASWAQDLAPARQLAEIVAGTDFVPAALRNNPDACCACIMYGLAIGAAPMVALQSIHVVDGRPQPSAELMRAMILAQGHTITVHTATDQLCRVSGLRAGASESDRVTVQWSIDDGRRAGLLNRPNWQRYPRAMLLARATSELARIAFPDAIKGLGQISEETPDELEAWASSAPAPEPEPVRPKTVRRRAPRAVAGRPVADVPLPEAVPDGEPEPGHPAPPWQASLDPWAATPDSTQGAPPVADSSHAPQVAPGAGLDPAGQPVASPLSDSLRRSLMAASSRVGVDPTRDRVMRLALWSALLARPITTANDLGRAEALTLLRRLNDIETGAVEWDYSVETGAVTLRHVDSEAP